jgi:triosephosphate isomerase
MEAKVVKVIFGNWKMNGSRKDIKKWFQNFFRKVEAFEKVDHRAIPDIVLCLPSIYLSFARQVATSYNDSSEQFKILIGAQDCHYSNGGSFTGNISPSMLGEFSIGYAIVGHSERRKFEGESNDVVARKASACLENGITPIICLGESLETRENGKYLEFVAKQAFESTENVDLIRTVIAYEPVWAIGTGKVPTMGEIEETVSYIKKVLSKKSSIDTADISLLYGGSVKADNAREITDLRSVDGVLVGGASLRGDEFFDLVIKLSPVGHSS